MLKLVYVVALLAITSPGVAQTSDSAAGTTAKPKKPKMVCRRDETTGSRLPGPSTCHTQEDWVRIDKINEERSRSAVNGARSIERSVATTHPM